MNLPEWLQQQPGNTENARFWFRTPMGLEQPAADEIGELLPVGNVLQTHRNVFVHLKDGPEGKFTDTACNLRLVDDAYRYWGCCRGIDRTKDSVPRIDAFLRPVLAAALAEYDPATLIRPTVSFVGKRNFNRFTVEQRIGRLVREQYGMKVLSNEDQEKKMDGELRLRCHIEDDVAHFGISLLDTPLHRRAWRHLRYTGQLHTTVAAAMARILAPPAGRRIIDPFCGSGTILIESAIAHPGCTFEGRDIASDALDIARQSAEQAGVDPVFQQSDSLENIPDSSGYYLISNPPWDEKHQIGDGHLPRFLKALKQWLEKSTHAVLLLPEEILLLLEEEMGKSGERLATTRVRGKLAEVVRFRSL